MAPKLSFSKPSPSLRDRVAHFRLIASQNQNSLIPSLLSSSPALSHAITQTASYRDLPLPTPLFKLPEGRKTLISFRNQDSFDAASSLVRKWGSGTVAVLNMANAKQPGGGYLGGATAQEEALCRRSTLYSHIAHDKFYPMDLRGGVWSPGVLVFRTGDDAGGALLEEGERFEVGVVSVAAIALPEVEVGGTRYADPKEEQLMADKITTILRIAKLHHQRVLVLGAFGCGAFRNPPSAVASLFLTALTKTEEFCDTFDEVVFAIIEREGSGNMRPWKEVWEGEGVAVEEEVVADRVKEGRKGKHWWNR